MLRATIDLRRARSAKMVYTALATALKPGARRLPDPAAVLLGGGGEFIYTDHVAEDWRHWMGARMR